MSGWVAATFSVLSGALITLLGVAAGGLIANRSQRRQWTRDKQIDAYAAVLQESTRMQLALLRRWKYAEHSDWTAWNQALAMLWLAGTVNVITEANEWIDCSGWLEAGSTADR